MKIELVKEYDNQGAVSYYTKVNNEIDPSSRRYTLLQAIETFNSIKYSYSKNRVEVLMVEEV